MSTTFRARIARTGQQSYPTGPEWRSPSDVFDSASLATLANLKVQIGHADGAPSVGHVVADSYGRERGPDGNEYLTALLSIHDADAIALIRGGRSSGISMGYQTQNVVRDGRNHQTQIRYEHLAILRRDVEAPRCGQFCQVKDRQDNMTTRTTDAIPCHCDGAPARKQLDTSTDEGLREFMRLRDLPGARYDSTTGILHIPDAPLVGTGAAPAAPRADVSHDDDSAFRASLAKKAPL